MRDPEANQESKFRHTVPVPSSTSQATFFSDLGVLLVNLTTDTNYGELAHYKIKEGRSHKIITISDTNYKFWEVPKLPEAQ